MVSADSTVEYRDVPGFPGYRVGDDGSVWSSFRRGHKGGTKERWTRLSPCLNRGYHYYTLHKNGKQHIRKAHRIVLEAFIGPCPEGKESRHGDGNRRNNALRNLCWGTKKENASDRRQHGNNPDGEKNPRSILSTEQVLRIRARLQAGEHQEALAKDYGVCQSTISAIHLRRLWKDV